MITHIPYYVPVLFMLTTAATLWLLLKASGHSRICLFIALVWLAFQGVLSYLGFYTVVDSIPPRPMLMVLPPLAGIILLFSTRWGRKFIDGFNPSTLTWLHVVRVPVEFVLFFLAAEKVVPDVMTFEGRNFDIISGLTAPIIAFYGMKRKSIGPALILLWNFICIGLLINVVAHGLFSIPSEIQQFEFNVPNIGLLYFPFNWLPAFIVPVVMFSHLVSLRAVIRKTY